MTLGDILMAGCAACVWGYHICMRICAIVCPGITAVATGAADPSVQTVREIRIDEDAEKRRARWRNCSRTDLPVAEPLASNIPRWRGNPGTYRFHRWSRQAFDANPPRSQAHKA